MIIIEKEIKITARVTKAEKQSIIAKAKKCGLTQSEYIKQRTLGYEPQAVPPNALFVLIEGISNLSDLTDSKKLNAKIENLLKEITCTLLLPRKEESLLQ